MDHGNQGKKDKDPLTPEKSSRVNETKITYNHEISVPNLFEDITEDKVCLVCNAAVTKDGFLTHKLSCFEISTLGGRRCECRCGAPLVSEVHAKKHVKYYCQYTQKLKRKAKVECGNCGSKFTSESNWKIHAYHCRGKFHIGPKYSELHDEDIKNDRKILDSVLEEQFSKQNVTNNDNSSMTNSSALSLSQVQSKHLPLNNVNHPTNSNRVTSIVPALPLKAVKPLSSTSNGSGNDSKTKLMKSNKCRKETNKKELLKTLKLMPVHKEKSGISTSVEGASSLGAISDQRLDLIDAGCSRLQEASTVHDNSSQRLQMVTRSNTHCEMSDEDVKTIFNEVVEELRAERRKVKEEINNVIENENPSAMASYLKTNEQSTSKPIQYENIAEDSPFIKFVCPCGERFLKNIDLLKHRKVCEKKCEFCSYVSPNLSNLRKHVVSNHRDIIAQQEEYNKTSKF